ncbi:MAG: hypothetical protein OEM67_09855 [Thermoleophilia bacterium]|nr:hypothetical protein [Thermoleophilia bacterium]
MEIAFQDRTVHLQSHWKPVIGPRSEERTWDVDYRAGLRKRSDVSSWDMTEVKDRLRDALGQIGAFAAEEGVGPWRSVFAAARAMLDAEDPKAPYYADILPNIAYSVRASQLVAACVTGWGFGGMGSWSDYYPRARAARSRYRVLGGQLRSALEEALLAAVNEGSVAG